MEDHRSFRPAKRVGLPHVAFFLLVDWGQLPEGYHVAMAFSWTDEQEAIFACKEIRLRVRAFAGASKTTSLVEYTKRHSRRRFLYLSYNRSIADEATGKFPRNVDCFSTHQVAYKAVAAKYKHKLGENLRPSDVKRVLNLDDWNLVRAAIGTVTNFLNSTIEVIHEDHLPQLNGRPVSQMSPSFVDAVFQCSQELWNRMLDPDDLDIPMLHDGYLKLYFLSKPDLSLKYDAVLADEAQDLNGITLGLAKSQSCQVILVGDTHQQLYSFRGSDNALSDPDLDTAVDLYLTKSFRFGPAVATIANILLSYKGETNKVVGAGYPTKVKAVLDSDAVRPALLHRTVMGVIMSALELTSKNKKIFWVGKIDSYKISDIEDLYWLSEGNSSKIKSKRLLKEFKNWDDYVSVAEASKDRDMARAIKIVTSYDHLDEALAQIRKLTVKDERSADVILSTAHRSKGLEFDYVSLEEDFPDPLDPEMPESSRDDEINLLYVAATRAKICLAVNSIIIGMMRDYERRRKISIQMAGN